MSNTVYLRLYEELNDYLPEERRKRRFAFEFKEGQSVGDLLAGLGVPAEQVEIVLAGGDSVGLSHTLRDGESVSCYPVFEVFDIRSLLRLRDEPLRHPSFAVAEGLSGLARYLRLCGFDTIACPAVPLDEIVRRAEFENRIVLVRRNNPLPGDRASRAWRIGERKPRLQILELLDALSLEALIIPLGRCPRCNGVLSGGPDAVQSRSEGPVRCGRCGATFGPRHAKLLESHFFSRLR